MARIRACRGGAGTVDLDHSKAGYHAIRALNPTGIVPAGPDHEPRTHRTGHRHLHRP